MNKATKRARWTVVILIVTGAMLNAPTLGLGFGYIIFDPSNFTKNVEQVVALLQQIEQAAEQVRQQKQMLAHLPASVLDTLALAGQSLVIQMNEVFGDPRVDRASVEAYVESWYPVVFPRAETAWLDTMRPVWMEAQRQQYLTESDLLNSTQGEMAATTGRLATLIQASNGGNADPNKLPGIVATAQAHQELLATTSGEIDKLLAIRTARAKRQVEARAAAQSETAYRNARRADLLNDWAGTHQSPPEAIRNPFLRTSHGTTE